AREEAQCALGCRAATSQVPVREADACVVEVQHERSLEGARELGRVHVAVDGVDGGKRGELVEHVLPRDVAGMQDTVDARERLPHRGRDHTTPAVDVGVGDDANAHDYNSTLRRARSTLPPLSTTTTRAPGRTPQRRASRAA